MYKVWYVIKNTQYFWYAAVLMILKNYGKPKMVFYKVDFFNLALSIVNHLIVVYLSLYLGILVRWNQAKNTFTVNTSNKMS